MRNYCVDTILYHIFRQVKEYTFCLKCCNDRVDNDRYNHLVSSFKYKPISHERSGRCRIVGFNARPLVYYVNIGGNVKTPPKNLMELPRGHFLGSFFGHKKVPSRDLCRAQKKYPRDLFRAQKKYPRDLFRAQKSTLGIFLGNKKVP